MSAPAPVVSGGVQASPRFYSIRGIDIATFFGSFVAGGYLLSRNFRRLDDPDSARNSVLVGLLGTIVIFIAAFHLPEVNPWWWFPFQTAQVGIIHLVARRLQGMTLATHEKAGGEFFSSWRAAGVGLLFHFGILGIMVVLDPL